MAHFLIFGGSEAHPRAWARCRAALAERGHESRVIDWPLAPWHHGMEAALEFLRDEISDVKAPVLVGHSMAGLFLPLLGQKVEARSEIYLAALVPHPERSIFERLFAGEEIFEPGWSALYQKLIATPEDPEVRQAVEQHLFHDGPGGAYTGYWRPFPLPLTLFYDVRFPLVQRASGSQRSNKGKPPGRSYLICGGDRTVSPAWQRFAARELEQNSTPSGFLVRITQWPNTGHTPHLARPCELASLLEQWA